MTRYPIYLDYNATTPVAPEVFAAMKPFLTREFGNPSSGHVYGRRAREAVERARAQVAGLIGAETDEIVFTSGGTEANNLAIRGVALGHPRPGRIVTSIVEHPATAKPCRVLEMGGWRVSRLKVDGAGRVSPDVAAALGGRTVLVTVMHSNNEVGTIQPVAEIARLARTRGALVHTDAAQSAGKVPLDVGRLGVDLLSIAGHKLYAPKGIGALYVRRGAPVGPILFGAGQEGGLRSGTEPVAAAVGLGAACALAAERLAAGEGERLKALRDRLWRALKEGVEGIVLNGHPVTRLPNTLNVRFPGVDGGRLLAAVPSVAASTGSACHAGVTAPSAVLLAMGVPAEAARGAVRLTLGRYTTEAEVDRAAAGLVRAWQRLQRL
jgi:cysteine desulfurase